MMQKVKEIMYLAAAMPNAEPMFPPTPKKWRGGKCVVRPINHKRRARNAVCREYVITMKQYRKHEKKARQSGFLPDWA